MKLVKFPDGIRNGRYVYVNPDNVTYLYESDDNGTYIVTIENNQGVGVLVPLPIDEVAGRLMNGNVIYEVISALKENNEGDE